MAHTRRFTVTKGQAHLLDRRLSRRAALRSGLGLATGLSAAYLIGCGDDDDAGPATGGSPAPAANATQAATIAGATTQAWRRIETTGPPPRRDHSLVADAEGRRAYVFGGRAPSGQTNDLWAFDVAAGAWSQLAPSGGPPAARFGHNAVFDAAKQRMVVFGGQAGSTFFSDIWAYDVRANAWSQIAGDGEGPRQRYGAGGAYDAKANALYVSHGFTNAGRFDDTWAFSLGGDAWRDVSPGGGERPLKRCLLRSAADPDRGRVLLFGGQSDGVPYLGDLWAFDLTARSWRKIEGEGPSPRNLYSLERRADAAQLLLFGGATKDGPSAETWQLDLAADRWSPLTVAGDAPSARSGHDAAWLAGRRSLLLFGGRADGELADLWELTFA